MTLAGGELRVEAPCRSDYEVTCRSLTLVPLVFASPHPRVRTAEQDVTLIYAASGATRAWLGPWSGPTSDRLGALIGRTRAKVLRRLAVPSSTTDLALVLRQSPASISEHLAVLRDTGLVESHRSGRHVIYRRTLLGSSLAASG